MSLKQEEHRQRLMALQRNMTPERRAEKSRKQRAAWRRRRARERAKTVIVLSSGSFDVVETFAEVEKKLNVL